MTDRSAEPGAQPAAPDDPEQLRQEIERTREQLGETVEALVAKTDVKARAKERANLLSQRLKGTTAQVKEQAAARAEQTRSQLAGKTADAKNAAVQTSGTTRNQLQARATAVGGTVRDKTPEPVQRAAQQVTQRASAVGAPRLGLVAAAVAGAAVAGIIVIRWRRRR